MNSISASKRRAGDTAKGLAALRELVRRKAEVEYLRFLDDDNPDRAYPTQQAFLESMAEIATLFGGNQTGKSRTLLHQDAWDLTGNYPAGYHGFRFHRPIDMWIVGETNELTRDSLQKVLFGPDPNRPGEGGLIPPSLIVGKPSMRHNIPGAFDTMRIRHVSGGTSITTFKSYAQGRANLQAWTGDVVHVDEEPPMDCWVELLMRLVARKGRMRLSFTTLKGYSDVVSSLLDEENKKVERFFLGANEARHLGQEHIDKIKALNLPEDEMNSRLYGLPPVKTGKIYKVDWSQVLFPRFPIPASWPTLGALDVGFDHPTALLQGYRDPQTGVKFITRAYKKSGLAYHHHACEMRDWSCKWVYDPAANQGRKEDGVKIAHLYMDELEPGWQYVPPDQRVLRLAENEVEAGLLKVQQEFENGKILIFDDLDDLITELKAYERKANGQIRKEKDDLCDDLRYLAMAPESYWEPAGKAQPWWMEFKQNPQAQTCQPGY